MEMHMTCECGKRLRVADAQRGKEVKCPHCGKTAIAPTTSPMEALGKAGVGSLPVARTSGGRLVAGWALVITAVVALLGTSVAVFYLVRNPASRSDTKPEETPPRGVNLSLTRFLPDRPVYLGRIQLNRMREAPAAVKLLPSIRKAVGPLSDANNEEFAGLTAEELDEFVIAGPVDGELYFHVLTPSKPVSADLLSARLKHREFRSEQIGAFTMYFTTKSGVFDMAFCVATERTVLVALGKGTKAADSVREILRRDRDAEFSDSIRAALQRADPTRPGIGAIDPKSLKATKSGRGYEDLLNLLDFADSSLIEIDLREEASISIAVRMPDATKAAEFVIALDAALKLFYQEAVKEEEFEPFLGVLNSCVVRSEREWATITLKAKPAELEALARNLGKVVP